MKTGTLLLFAWIAPFLLWAQPCPTEELQLTSQSQIDNFSLNYPGCTDFPGGIFINDLVQGDITNLNGLTQVINIGQRLTIIDNPNLTSLVGLDHLETIGRDLIIQSTGITDLNGLGALNYIHRNVLIGDNPALNDLHGLDNLTFIGKKLSIRQNNVLSSLNGLNGLSSIGGTLRIEKNPALADLSALSALLSIGGNLYLVDNDALTSLSGLENINPNSISQLRILGSQQLNTCSIASICNYIANPANQAVIGNNAPGCNSEVEVEAACIPLPTCPTSLNFTSQAQINAFPSNYPNCSVLDGDVTINGTGIVDLSPFSQIEEVTGILSIGVNPVGTSLVDLTGLDNLHTARAVKIQGNDLLTSLHGLESLTTLTIYLTIYNCPMLTDISALSNLTEVGGGFGIGFCDALTNLHGIENMSVQFSIDIYYNASLVDITAFSSMTHSWDLQIEGNQSLQSLAGLENLQSVDNDLVIGNNPVSSLSSLGSLSSVGERMIVQNSSQLSDFSGLENLTYIGEELRIFNNQGLTSLSGLDNFDPDHLDNLVIQYCPLLSVCAVPSVCDYLSDPAHPATISNNALGCNTRMQVEAACPTLSLSPNPVKDLLVLDVSDFLGQMVDIVIVDQMGRPVWQYRHDALPVSQLTIQIPSSGLKNKGWYTLTCISQSNVQVEHLVVE